MVGLLLFGIGATFLMDSKGLDLAWAAEFYAQDGPHQGWIHSREQPWAWLYDYGEIPGWIVVIGAVTLYGAARAGKIRPEYKRSCLVIILTIALGPGLLVNGILKSSWGRPRPADVSLFGGGSEYRTVWQPGGPGQGRSFACGHCSMAFALSSLAAFYPWHPGLSAGALVAGTAYGTVMSVARVAQGGHFPTDCLWSAIIVLMLLAGLYYLVFRVPERLPAKTSAGLERPRPGS
jgi:membrane-associated PAP2 superfamily phosphatase